MLNYVKQLPPLTEETSQDGPYALILAPSRFITTDAIAVPAITIAITFTVAAAIFIATADAAS